MFPRTQAVWAATVLLAAATASLAAQSLADVARKEEERRKEIKTPGKVYTNKDIAPAPPVSAAPPPATNPATPAAADASKPADADKGAAKDEKTTSKDAGTAKAGAAAKEVVKDQTYWSKRMKDLQTQLDRDVTFADALQSRINGLTADFAARDDPAQRAIIGQDRQKAVDELARVKKAIEDEKKAVADLQEEARRASVPAGWLR